MYIVRFWTNLSYPHCVICSWTSDWFIQWTRGFHKNDMKGGSIQSREFVRKVYGVTFCLMKSKFSCFDGFYFVFILYRFKKKFMSPVLCSLSQIGTSGWRSHGNIKLGKPHSIFAWGRQHSVHICDMEHKGRHNLILYKLKIDQTCWIWQIVFSLSAN